MQYFDLALRVVGAIALALGILATLARALPDNARAYIRSKPRLDNAVRVARAGGVDAVKVLRAAAAMLRGTPWLVWSPMLETLAGGVDALVSVRPTNPLVLAVGVAPLGRVEIAIGDRAVQFSPEEALRIAENLSATAMKARASSPFATLRGATTPFGIEVANDDGADDAAAPRRTGERGFAHVVMLAMVLFLGLVAMASLRCTPQPVPPSDGGPVVVTPSSWVRTARIAVTVGRGLILPARAIVEATVSEPGLTRARRGFDVADRALGGLDLALTAYEARGGDACAVYAAAGAATIALQELAAILAEEGFAFGVPLGRVLDMVGGVVDTLVPRCDQADAGFRSAGRAANTAIADIERRARLRGVILRRDLDSIAPVLGDAGVR